MANIKVDYIQLEKTAAEIETYITEHNNKMKTIDQTVDVLKNSWNGKDYTAFKESWQQIEGRNSTSDKMLKALKSYGDFLRFAANKYKSAQAKAMDKAERLLKYQ